MALAIIIPSFDRKVVLEASLNALLKHVGADDTIVVITCRKEDEPAIESPCLVSLSGRKGSSCQRNQGLEFLSASRQIYSAVLFIDDDVVLAPRFLENLLRLHSEFPEVAGFTVNVIADGAVTWEIPLQSAEIAAISWQEPCGFDSLILSKVPYGGISMRGDLLGRIQFDERLAEYGFMEDLDFFVRLRDFGSTGYAHNCGLVHLAVGSGRTNQRKLGFSQIMNPLYLAKKGSLSWVDCSRHVTRVIAANFFGAFRSRRRQRFIGNLLAWGFFLRKGPCPEMVARI
jgi:GT2 family glycosyltransferase